MLKKFIISPPFGTYFSHKKATSVLGTFTAMPRPGKWGQVAKTLRYTKDGWVNRIGLRNKGISSIKDWHYRSIYSLSALNSAWYDVTYRIPELITIEMNLSCPNVKATDESDPLNIDAFVLTKLAKRPAPTIMKLPPIIDLGVIRAYYGCGIRYFHISNTIPTDRGGLSGRRIQQYSLPLIEAVKKEMPDTKIIGGGGIYDESDLCRYKNAGADHFSLATIWFNPWRAKKLITKAIQSNLV